MKTIRNQKIHEKEETTQNFLHLFVKHQNITELEVSVFKDKKICLVCKGKLSDVIYLCTNCGVFYCSKCSDTLINVENACWYCNEPLDESKPVKKIEKKAKKELEISKNKHKDKP